MPIYDQGYERWKGEIQQHPMRWWPIARQGVLQVLPQRKYLALLVLAWIGPLLRGVQLMGALSDRLASITDAMRGVLGGILGETGPEFFWSVINAQGLFVLLFTVMVGSDLVASDRRFKALQLYFSKPLTPNDYILGKLGIIATFLLLAVWVPAMLLWLFALMLEPSLEYYQQIWAVPLAITAYSVMLIGVAGLLMLALSSVGSRGVYIAGSWLILYGYGPFQLVVELLKGISGNEYWGLISIESNLDHVGASFFGAGGPHDFHATWSLLALLVVAGVSYFVLRKRIEPVEVVL